MKKKTTAMILWILIFCFSILSPYTHLHPEELPRPTYDNSFIFSMIHGLVPNSPGTEIQYVKSRFGNGLYAPLVFSTFLGADMDWHHDITGAGDGIRDFKDSVDLLVERAASYGVGAHIILTYGTSRNPNFYKAAKEEDLRCAQWYNDNNPASRDQLSLASQAGLDPHNDIGGYLNLPGDFAEARENTETAANDPTNINVYVYSTHSRYARKLRNHLEAKVKAVFDYLKGKQDENPELLIVISGPGEAELNSLRIDNSKSLQTFFCDYSPFAVLEFRDWIQHEGMYGTGGKYQGEGYAHGGSRYRGANGLQNFNTDFGTAFTTWDLKYYDWNLSDPVDSDYTDNANPDPNIIPVNDYTFDGMMPASGEHFISGGFDPPRVMLKKGVDAFWDLWQTFRETMVYHYVKDIAAIAGESGLSKKHYYTHQIPGDYLFGTRPNDPAIPNLNPRYYSSASPLWTADAYTDTGMGVTAFDVNFGTRYTRTTQYLVPTIAAMSNNWGVVEYNPEVTAASVQINTVQSIYEQILRLYNNNAHFIAFYKWISAPGTQFKDTNREYAAKQFFDAVKDKARRSVSTVFTPKQVENAAGQYNNATASIRLTWSPKIWTDLDYRWNDWGDFKEFVIYRGYTENFQTETSAEIARLTDYSYNDTGFVNAGKVYYKLAAVNVNGEMGSPVTIGVLTGGSGGTPVLNISQSRLNFGASTGGPTSPSQSFLIDNTGDGALTWWVSDNAEWLHCTPSSGVNSGTVEVTVNASGKSPGTYNGTITVTASNAVGSPGNIQVTLNVYQAGQDAAPFGMFETPVQDATVRSSIPVTGWVLDDIAVESVKIYRQQGGALMHLDDAVLVEGARPDIEASYPAYPGKHKAGWGYMMLTNFLPNQGNGTYTFHVIARDVTGHEVTLGAKTVICDNAHAVKPFGAIDTPAQGGTASGSSYVNFGWALTPQPNTIPTDGSTINIFVDGVYLGHPVYNNYRADIASLFPAYANSNGAVGYFYLDTAQYEDGIHTIAWSARDNGGNIDGIGSRYFTIRNSNSDRRSSANSHPTPAAGIDSKTLRQIPANKSGPVGIVKGYKTNAAPQKIYPGNSGNITVIIKELERIEVHMDKGKHLTGYLEKGDGPGPLPVGSYLDKKTGIFYWQPGLAFVGKYTLVFLSGEEKGKFFKRTIIIKIVPRT